MDYEKAYKQALERVRELLSRCIDDRDRRTKVYRVEDIESIFPELAENKDEKVRKGLIKYFKNFDSESLYTVGLNEEEILVWLDKQGETFTKKDIDNAYLEGMALAKHELEKQYNNNEVAKGILRGAAIHLITWIDYNAAEGNMCLSNMECEDIENALVNMDWDKIYTYMKKKLEKQ